MLKTIARKRCFVVLTCILYSSVCVSTQTYTVNEMQDGFEICVDIWDRCHFVSFDYIKKHYKGLLVTRPINDTCPEEHEPPLVGVSYCCGIGQSDGDRCCETVMCNYYPTSATAIDGNTYYVVHITSHNLYQAVPIGECGETGICPQCTQVSSVHALLVWDPVFPYIPWWNLLSFKLFLFPSHCVCHSV